MNHQSATAIQRGIAAVDAQHLNDLAERWQNTARGDGLFPEEAIEIAAPLADAWCDLTWKPGPPKQDDFKTGDWVACATEKGGRYCCFSSRGMWWRENPVTFLPVPLDLELWESTAFHFPIPAPPSGDSE